MNFLFILVKLIFFILIIEIRIKILNNKKKIIIVQNLLYPITYKYLLIAYIIYFISCATYKIEEICIIFNENIYIYNVLFI